MEYVVTHHALKKARKRFKITDPEEAKRYLVEQLQQGVILQHDEEAEVWTTDEASVVTSRRVEGQDTVVIVTCYRPSNLNNSRVRRRIALFKERRKRVPKRVDLRTLDQQED